MCPQRASREIPVGFPVYHLESNISKTVTFKRRAKVGAGMGFGTTRTGESHEPRIRRFFSGKRFPLATPSSREDQIFLEPSLLDGRLLDPGADFEPRFGLDEAIVWSGSTMPQGAETIPSTGY